ncbi:MAG: hypothetical protein IJP68_02610 [Selenomonadaceae bacterium]|nr:hypothetical protein [Selenomonadaceae bacterium]
MKYLLTMYSELTPGVNGYSIVAQSDKLNTDLLKTFDILDDESIGSERFPERTDQIQKYLFDLNYENKTIMPFEWIDYPGGLLRNVTYEGYDEVSKTIKDSSTLFIF